MIFQRAYRALKRAGTALAAMSGLFAVLAAPWAGLRVEAAESGAAAALFRKEIHPIMSEFCSDCHADGMNKGSVAFDEYKSDQALLEDRNLWLRVLKNLQAGTMPPEKKPRPSAEQLARLEKWIKADVFQIDPRNPDPGRVTVRRLNRVEYRNTIRDLMGVDYDTSVEFPADDSGHGFDNIADVLTLPPMLLEKYLDAARTIVTKAVPAVPRVPAERVLDGRSLAKGGGGPLTFSYYEKTTASNTFQVEHAGRYQVVLNLSAHERFVDNVFDLNKCRLVVKIDGEEVVRKEFNREGGKPFSFEFDRDWKSGAHELAFEVEPLTTEKQVRSLTLRINSVTLRGPMDEKFWTRPKNHERFFAREAPEDPSARRAYARELLGAFASKAFRRPVDAATSERLASLAESIFQRSGQTFEAGVAHAMVAVLASPRFLFLEEAAEPAPADGTHPFVDEHALASRLSYFLWSTMPDDELRRLADKGELRKNLRTQVKRMLADWRSYAFIQNFPGQWLQTRDVDSVPIDARAVLAREDRADPAMERTRTRFRELRQRPEESLSAEEKAEFAKLRDSFGQSFRRVRVEFNGELRSAMRQETEKFFEHIVRQDRPITELIDSGYTFLNERLARHYGISNVLGNEMRLVQLATDSPRGGVLSMGSVLAVTSNPTRTSPVKRGVFILDNILGMPPPPPPPDIPPLEDSAKAAGRELTLRETLELHRGKPLCSSCHNRMDPLGLALENFNAMGMWREKERDHPVEVSGKLITGEEFTDIRGLKRILVEKHSRDFHHCLTEKLLTYALGRGLEYYDVATQESIVERIEKEEGRFSALLLGVIESAPFQKRRSDRVEAVTPPVKPAQQRAELKLKP